MASMFSGIHQRDWSHKRTKNARDDKLNVVFLIFYIVCQIESLNRDNWLFECHGAHSEFDILYLTPSRHLSRGLDRASSPLSSFNGIE